MRPLALALVALLVAAPAAALGLSEAPLGALANEAPAPGAPSARSAAAAEPWPYGTYFDCPPDALPGTCPLRVRAPGAALGAPALAPVAGDPRSFAMLAIGGARADDGGRESAPLVLYVTRDAGRTFEASTLALPEAADVAREVALASDDRGRLVAGAVVGAPGAPGRVLLWRLGAFPGDASVAPEAPAAWAADAGADRLSLAHVGNGTVVALWQETGVAPDQRAGLGAAPYPRAAWADATAGSWTTHARPPGPCADVSNVVSARAGNATFACASALDYLVGTPVHSKLRRNETLRDGDLLAHAIDPANGTVSFLGRAPVRGEARLAVGLDGRIGLAASVLDDDGLARLNFTSTADGVSWSFALDAMAAMRGPDPKPLTKFDLLAMAHRPSSDTYYLVLREVEREPPAPLAPRENKSLVVLDRVGHPVFRQDLGVDRIENRLARGLDAQEAAPTPDRADALLAIGTRIVIAYGDAGELVVGELVELAADVPPRPTDPEPVQPASTQTAISTKPPRKFTLPFLVITGALVALAAARALLGPVLLRADAPPPPGDKKP